MRVQPTAKSLILDLLSSLHGGAMPVRGLVAAGALFTIPENGVRVELARLVARGLVERNAGGHYRLAGGSAPIQRRVASWTRAAERMAPWTGTWMAVHTAGLPRSARPAVRKRARAFAFLGFRELSADLWVRPQNLRASLDDVRRELHALGLDPAAPVFSMTDLDPATTARALALWDGAALCDEYRALRRSLAASARHLRTLEQPEAMVETFLLGGRGIRLLALDPLLPEPIVPARERQALVEALRRYDRLGKGCWRPFMAAHGSSGPTSPKNLRLVGIADSLAATDTRERTPRRAATRSR